MAGVLLDEAEENPAEVGAFAAASGVGAELVQPARAQRLVDHGAGASG
ncbi:hypothetical protein [Streptomyces sp. NPDC001515]